MASRNQIDLPLSGSTGTGSFVGSNSPTFTTPSIGAATVTSINKMAITAPATSSTLAIADGKTFTDSNTLTFTGTDSSSVNVAGGGTVLYQTTGSIVQSVSSSIISGSSTNSLTYVDVTGANLSITPKSSSNKVLIIITFEFGYTFVTNKNLTINLQLLRTSTVIPTGVAYVMGIATATGSTDGNLPGFIMYQDSPTTSSSVTYKLQQESVNSSSTVTTTNILFTLMEISA